MGIPIISVPPSKSLTHRALFCAALADGVSVIENPLLCDDTLVTKNVLEILRQALMKPKTTATFDCWESGTTWRFLMAITYALGLPCHIHGAESLLRRPIAPLKEALKNLGGKIFLKGNLSSQFLSALLLAAPLAKQPTIIHVEGPLVSKPYVDLTIDVQKKFGVNVVEASATKQSSFFISPQKYQPTSLQIEGDWSSAAVWIAAGLLYKEVTLEGLNPKSLQGDRQILDIVKELGGKFFWMDGKLIVKKSPLRGIRWDLSQTPDLFPILSVLAAAARGKSEWSGIERLQFKESNRLQAINNPAKSRDHRIIMAGAISALATGRKIVFENPQCVAKSYPDFWKDYEQFTR